MSNLNQPNNRNTGKLEEEFSKQIDQIDRRLDRSGWFYLVIVLAIFFLVVYFTINLFRIPTSEYQSSDISSFEKRIETLESRINELEDSVAE